MDQLLLEMSRLNVSTIEISIDMLLDFSGRLKVNGVESIPLIELTKQLFAYIQSQEQKLPSSSPISSPGSSPDFTFKTPFKVFDPTEKKAGNSLNKNGVSVLSMATDPSPLSSNFSEQHHSPHTFFSFAPSTQESSSFDPSVSVPSFSAGLEANGTRGASTKAKSKKPKAFFGSNQSRHELYCFQYQNQMQTDSPHSIAMSSAQSQDGKRIDECVEAAIASDLSQKVAGISLDHADISDVQAAPAGGDGFKGNVGGAPMDSGGSSVGEKAGFLYNICDTSGAGVGDFQPTFRVNIGKATTKGDEARGRKKKLSPQGKAKKPPALSRFFSDQNGIPGSISTDAAHSVMDGFAKVSLSGDSPPGWWTGNDNTDKVDDVKDKDACVFDSHDNRDSPQRFSSAQSNPPPQKHLHLHLFGQGKGPDSTAPQPPPALSAKTFRPPPPSVPPGPLAKEAAVFPRPPVAPKPGSKSGSQEASGSFPFPPPPPVFSTATEVPAFFSPKKATSASSSVPAPADDAMQRMKDLADLFRRQGRELYDSNDYARSLDCFTKALQCMPAHCSWEHRQSVLANRAAVLFMLERYVEAIEDCDTAICEDALFTKLHVRRGKAFLRLGNTSSAAEACARVLEASVKDAGLDAAKADARAIIKQVVHVEGLLRRVQYIDGGVELSSLLHALDELLTVMPACRALHARKAQVLCQMKKWEEAAAYAEACALVDAQPSTARLSAHARASEPMPSPTALAFKERIKPARESAKSSSGKPKSELLLDSSAVAQAILWMGPSLGRVYLTTLKNSPFCRKYCAEVMEKIASVLKLLSESVKGMEANGSSDMHKQVIDGLPTDWTWVRAEDTRLKSLLELKAKADDCFRQQKFEFAISGYSSAITLDGEAVRWTAILHCNRAAAHMGAMMYTEAVTDCHQSVSRYPDYARAYLRRARAYAAMKQLNASVRDYRHYLCSDGPLADAKEVEVELEAILVEQKRKLQEDKARHQEHEQQKKYQEQNKKPHASHSNRPHSSFYSFHENGGESDDEPTFPGGYSKFEKGFSDYFSKSSAEAGEQKRRAGGADRSASGGPFSSSSSSSRGHRGGGVNDENRDPDHYATLGVGVRASDREIRMAYHRLALQFHPDKNREEGAEEIFKSITSAYSVLSDKAARDTYDRARPSYARHTFHKR